jgi:asparagine synthase (glutamine-hydrolysing)
MPGIVGLVTKIPRKEAELQLIKMVETLRHENFYVTGTWVDEGLGVYVGWVARRNSYSDGMPLLNEKGDVVLIFSGEEFSGQEMRDILQLQGHMVDLSLLNYQSHIHESGHIFPASLNGRFHGLLIDRTRRVVTLFNDRYGMHRIYYHESKEGFYFAAEAKAILACCPQLRRDDPKGLGEFIACGCVMENRTIFEGIDILPPASAWVFQDKAVAKKGVYFEPREWEEQPQLDPETYYQEIKNVFSRSVSRYFVGKEQIGMSLTGGLDSRLIMAWQKPAPGSLPCYTFGGMFRDSQDVIVGRKVAQACQQSYEVIQLGTEFLSRFPHYAERAVYLTDGCLALTHSPDLYLNEKARHIAPIRITGNYGSEVFRLHRAFKPEELSPGLFHSDVLPFIRGAGNTYTKALQGHPLSFAVFRQAPWHHYALLALEESQLALRSPFLDNDVVRTLYRAPTSTLTNYDVCLRLIADGDLAFSWIRTDRGIGGVQRPLYSVTTRNILEFLFRAEYAYDYGMPQWVARIDHLFSMFHLERLFLGRHKFHHFRIWYRDALSSYVREILLDQRTLSRPYFNPKKIENIVEGHLTGNYNYTAEIHKILNLELLYRLFIDT